MSRGRELRFGVRAGDRHSQYWKVKADSGRSDFYVSSQRTGPFLHVSLHDPRYGMRVAVTLPTEESERVMEYPNPLAPGVTRLVQIVVPPAAVSYPAPARSDVRWVVGPDDPKIWVSFEVLSEAPEVDPTDGDWKHGTELVGRVPRSDGGTIAVVVWLMSGSGGHASFTPRGGDPDAVRAAVAAGGVRALVHGRNPDGSLWFLELFPEAASHSAVRQERIPRRPDGLRAGTARKRVAAASPLGSLDERLT
jgi:hypothetical protein